MQRDGEPAFTVGAKVEAKRNLGWFSATVLKVIGTTSFLVEYDVTGVNCNGELRKEILDAQYVRPAAYDLPETKEFSVSGEVEVFCDGGWLPGVVSNVLPGSRYAVNVNGEQMGEEMEFDDTLIRSRREWNGRQWIDSSTVVTIPFLTCNVINCTRAVAKTGANTLFYCFILLHYLASLST